MYPDRKRFCSYFVALGRNPVDRTAARAFIAVRPLHKRAYEAIEARRNGRSAGETVEDRWRRRAAGVWWRSAEGV